MTRGQRAKTEDAMTLRGGNAESERQTRGREAKSQ